MRVLRHILQVTNAKTIFYQKSIIIKYKTLTNKARKDFF